MHDQLGNHEFVALQRIRLRVREIFDHLAVPAVGTDLDGMIMEWNSLFMDLTDGGIEPMFGQPFISSFVQPSSAAKAKSILSVSCSAHEERLEMRLLNGRDFKATVAVVPMSVRSDGEVTGMIWVVVNPQPAREPGQARSDDLEGIIRELRRATERLSNELDVQVA